MIYYILNICHLLLIHKLYFLQKNVITIVDRKEAIRTACMLAQPGDVILVAGKGHENYQEIKGVKHHFDDKEVLREVFGN